MFISFAVFNFSKKYIKALVNSCLFENKIAVTNKFCRLGKFRFFKSSKVFFQQRFMPLVWRDSLKRCVGAGVGFYASLYPTKLFSDPKSTISCTLLVAPSKHITPEIPHQGKKILFSSKVEDTETILSIKVFGSS